MKFNFSILFNIKILLLFLPLVSFSQVLIITHSYNRPDFIEIQYKAFKKFMRDDYEFVVFNDARSSAIRDTINQLCQKLNLRCIEIPQEIHNRPYLERLSGEDFNNPNARCANVVQYSLDVLGFAHKGLVMIIDSDMFLIEEFSLDNYMQQKFIAGVKQTRTIEYLWNGLVFFNMESLPNRCSINFNCGIVQGHPCDVGGYLFYYFKDNPTITPSYIDCLHINEKMKCNTCQRKKTNSCTHNTDLLKSYNFQKHVIELIQTGIDNIEFLLDHKFLHYRGGQNWNGKSQEYHNHKTGLLNEFINKILC